MKQTKKLITEHFRKYPRMQIQDALKFIFQSAKGCEHMMSSVDDATYRIRSERESLDGRLGGYIDELDGGYSRVHLSCLDRGLNAATLARLFIASSKDEKGNDACIEKKLVATRELIKDGTLPFPLADFDSEAESWRACGYPAIHHSEIFRREYTPSYRVISNRFIPLLPLFERIDSYPEGQRLILAIEGGSASGKTTLGKLLSELYDCTVFHMDDFFLRPEQRTAARLAEAGGNVDRERFLDEVLDPLSRGEPVNYRRFDCSVGELSLPIVIHHKRLTVVEGAYSMHPELADRYSLSVFLDISPRLQRERIEKRNSPEMAKRFFDEWIPLERAYFDHTQAPQRCDLIISQLQ